MTMTDDLWKETLLANLTAAGGEGTRTADYIRQQQVAFSVVETDATNLWWRPRLGWSGLRLQNRLYLSRHLRRKPPDSPWLLASIVHEVTHLRQGLRRAFSVHGELEAWQAGFRFYQALPGVGPLSPPLQELLNLPLSHDRHVLRQARLLINLDQNGGTSLHRQVLACLKGERSFHRIYWILVLPLNPLFHCFSSARDDLRPARRRT